MNIMKNLKRLVRDRKGNVSLMFGFAALPLFAASGMAIDYSHSSAVFSKTQNALDSAVLAASVAKAMPSPNTTAEQQTKAIEALAQSYFVKNLPPSLKSNPPQLNLTINNQLELASASVDVTVPTTMLRVVGINHMANTLTTNAKLPIFSEHRTGEISIVMDYSGSMNSYLDGQRKYITMRNEVTNLVTAITQDSVNKYVKIGLVPFSDQVRVAMPKRYWKDKGNGWRNYTGCTRDRRGPYNTTNATPSRQDQTDRWGWLPSNPGWLGNCNTYKSKGLTIKGLGKKHKKTLKMISKMQPYGNTNLALGMEFAYHMLSPNQPFNTAADFDTKGLVKAVVFLSDGAQTTASFGANGSLQGSSTYGKQNFSTICTNMKNDGIRVFTVAFDLNNQNTINMLRNCASVDSVTGVADAFTANSTSELSSAFGTITGKLARTMYLSE